MQPDSGIAYDGITATAAPASRKCQGLAGVYHAKSKKERIRKMVELNEKVPIKIPFCPSCMSKNTRRYHEKGELAHKKGWHRGKYWMPMIFCRDCKEHFSAFEGIKAQHDAAMVAMDGMTVKQIKDLRKSLGFKSAVSFARYLGVGDSTVKRWENRSSWPSPSGRMLLKLAAAGVDLSIVKNKNRNDED